METQIGYWMQQMLYTLTYWIMIKTEGKERKESEKGQKRRIVVRKMQICKRNCLKKFKYS